MSALELQLATFAATLVIELPLYAAFAGAGERRRVLAFASFANLVTHSMASALAWSASVPWLAIECAVVAVEFAILSAIAGWPWKRAALAAAVANGASATAAWIASSLVAASP